MPRDGRHPLDRARIWTRHTPPGAKPYLLVSCDYCESTQEHACSINTPPNVVANALRRLGWHIKGEGKKAKCPACVHRPKPKKPTPVLDPVVHEPAPPPVELDERTCTSTSLTRALKAFFHSHGFTQKDLAQSSEVSQGTISRAARGLPVGRHFLDKLALVIAELTGKHVQVEPVTYTEKPKSRPRAKPAPNLVLKPDRGAEPKPPAPPPAPQPKPGPESRRQQRVAFSLLEEHYDDSACAYDKGWSDERIAKDTGLSREFVAQTREDAFGPLVDPAIAGLEKRLKHLEQRLVNERAALKNEATRRLGAIELDLEQMRKEIRSLRSGPR